MKRRAVFHPLTPDITCINDAGDSVCYVVCGKERAAVIDTVNGMEDLHAIVREITDLPLVVIDTHGHCDHVWGNPFFDEACIHPADIPLHDLHFAMRAATTMDQAPHGATEEDLKWFISGKPCPLKPIGAGDIIDLGGRTLEVILIAGHTPGSIALLDSQTGFLFCGDAINGQLWLQLEESTKLSAYLDSLNALDAYRPRITELHTGHNVDSVPPSFIDDMRAAISTILSTGGAGDDDFAWFGGIAKRHLLGPNSWILYTPEKL